MKSTAKGLQSEDGARFHGVRSAKWMTEQVSRSYRDGEPNSSPQDVACLFGLVENTDSVLTEVSAIACNK